MCAVNLMQLFKNILLHFRIDKISLLPERFRKPSARKLSWEDTYREMAASSENWSDWNIAINDGLDDSETSAKIKTEYECEVFILRRFQFIECPV